MAARLQADIGSRAPCHRPRCGEGVNLGMRLSRAGVPAFADDCAVPHDHAADARVRRGRIKTVRGERERTRHELIVRFTAH